jgi:hypothetical protein
MERQLKIREKELKEELNETISLNQKTHHDEVDKLKLIHAQEVTRLKGEKLEIKKYNGIIEDRVRRLQ